MLHHPLYRARHATDLKRDLPRIPFAPDFTTFAEIGEKLAELHMGYEDIEPYALTEEEHKTEPYSQLVGKTMALSKDKTKLKVNKSLTLAGIPLEAFEYRLGNRSALHWVLDQYRVTEKKGVRYNPNRLAEPGYIATLVGRVVAVSLQTVQLVRQMPEEFCEA